MQVSTHLIIPEGKILRSRNCCELELQFEQFNAAAHSRVLGFFLGVDSWSGFLLILRVCSELPQGTTCPTNEGGREFQLAPRDLKGASYTGRSRLLQVPKKGNWTW